MKLLKLIVTTILFFNFNAYASDRETFSECIEDLSPVLEQAFFASKSLSAKDTKTINNMTEEERQVMLKIAGHSNNTALHVCAKNLGLRHDFLGDVNSIMDYKPKQD